MIKSALLISSVLVASSAFAQYRSESSFEQRLNPEAGTASTNGGLLMNRLSSIDLNGIIREMERDGVKERKFIISVGMSGAISYERDDNAEEIERVYGEKSGSTVIPFTVNLTNDGRVLIQAALFGDKEGRPTSMLNSIEVAVLTYDKESVISGVTEFHADIVKYQAKVPLHVTNGSSLVASAGAGVGFGSTDVNVYTNNPIQMGGMQGSFEYGLKFSKHLGSFRLDASTTMKYRAIEGSGVMPASQAAYDLQKQNYESDLEIYNQAKLDYEQKNTGGTKISYDSFDSLTGNKKPKAPANPKKESFSRTQVVSTSAVGLTKKFQSGRSVQLELRSDRVLKDHISKHHQDLRQGERPWATATLRIRF